MTTPDQILSAYPEDPTVTFSQDFLHCVAQDLVPGFSFVDKFGENPIIATATDPEDIWEVGGTYVYDADGTAPIVSLVSDAAADTEPIEIQGLDINGIMVTQTLTLTGTTRVPLTTALWRVFRMQNIGTADLAGTVYCYASTDAAPSAADIRAAIVAAANQTLMSIYTVPADKVGFLLEDEVGASRFVAAAEVRAALRVRKFGGVFAVKRRVNLSNAGTSIDKDLRLFPMALPGKTDVKHTVEEVSATVGVFGTFQILLIEQERLPVRFLAKIGQPS